MKLLLLVTIFLWSTVMPTWAQTVYTFYLPTLDAYSRSVTGLRNLVKLRDRSQNEVTCFGLPMLRRENSFILVELRAEVTITLALHRDTLYVEGYSDRVNGRCRSYVFHHGAPGAQGSLCAGEGNPVRVTLGYTSQYSAVEAVGGARGNVDIGINVLKERMISIYGQNNPDRIIQAQFILGVAQMVSEAVRFSYIQKQVMSYPEFKPNPRIVSLENKWNKISECFEHARSDGTIPNEQIKKLEGLLDESGRTWTVTKVSDVVGYIGLLNYFDPNRCQVRRFNQFPDQLITSI